MSAPSATTTNPIPVAARANLNAFNAPVDVPTTAVYADCKAVAILVCAIATFSVTTLFNCAA